MDNTIAFSSVELKRAEYLRAQKALRELVLNNEDLDITEILTVENVEEALIDNDCDDTVRMQLCIFIKEGNVTRYITQTEPGLCSLEYNNIILSTTERTGLDQTTVIALLNVILGALSIAPEQHDSVRISNGKMQPIKAVTSKGDEAALLRVRLILEEYASGDDVEERDLEKTLKDLNRMADAGIPDALYMKGVCYLVGIATPKDPIEARRYLMAAARGGSSEANAVLGDACFEKTGFNLGSMTEAYERYTAFGATALSEKRQNNLKTLIEERELNTKLFVFNVLAFFGSIILNAILAGGTFTDGKKHLFFGILAIVLSLGLLILSYLEFRKWAYDEQRWVIPGYVIITLLLMLIVL